MKRTVLIAVTCVCVATPALAGLSVTYDLNAAVLAYNALGKTLDITQNAGSNFLVRKEDSALGEIDNTQVSGTDFSFLLHLDLVDLPGDNNWSGTGTLSFTDTGSANVVEAAAQVTSVMRGHPFYGTTALVITANLSDLGLNDSILVGGSDPWVFEGTSEIAGEPTDGASTPNKITISQPENYDTGWLLTIKFPTPGNSLDSLFLVDRNLTGGEVKGEIVPLPAAVLLGLLGLGAAGLKLRRHA